MPLQNACQPRNHTTGLLRVQMIYGGPELFLSDRLTFGAVELPSQRPAAWNVLTYTERIKRTIRRSTPVASRRPNTTLQRQQKWNSVGLPGAWSAGEI